jgi:uncharacterized protein YjgD (DUF1641 family)
MEEKNLQMQIDEINRKLDIIVEEIELQKRHRREMEDLKEDLMRVGKDVYDSTILELEEVHDHIKTGDMLHLFKKILRNVNNITKTFEQLENFKDFIQNFAPVSRELFLDFMNKLNEYDKKGYFEFAKEFTKISDNVVTSFTVKDVKNFGDNIAAILDTIKNLTQPDMLHALNNAVNVYKNLDIEISEKVSIFSLMKELNTPEVKKGLSFGIKFLKNIAQSQEKSLTIKK